MRALIKSCFSMMVAGLLMFSLSASAADAAKGKYGDYRDRKDDPVAQCQAGCKPHEKDNVAYENCMVKCRKDHKKDTTSIMPKK